MSTPNLEQIIPDAKKRSIIYRVFALLGLVLGGSQIGFAAASVGQPVWLTVGLAIYGFLGLAGFGMADRNTPTGGKI